MRANCRGLKADLTRRMHEPIPQQEQWLAQVMRGYLAYHAVPTNSRRLAPFHYHVLGLWRRTLRRRGQRNWTDWERIYRLASDYLPTPRILHPYPNIRFTVRHPRWESDA